jgi:hypothetical protein
VVRKENSATGQGLGQITLDRYLHQPRIADSLDTGHLSGVQVVVAVVVVSLTREKVVIKII